MRWFSLSVVFLRISTLNEMAYRANFWIAAFESLLSMAVALGTIYVVFEQTGELGGWQRSELICLLGVYFIILGLINTVISPSLNKFMMQVVDGNLDYTLTKPADAQLLVSISEFRIWKVLDIILGILVLGAGLVIKSQSTDALSIAMFCLAMVSAIVIVYSFWMMLATLSFWFIRVENISMIFLSMYTAGRWPVGIYPSWLRLILTLIVPIAFAVTVPAQALANRLDWEHLAGSVLLSITLLIVSRRFWTYGIRFYSGASA